MVDIVVTDPREAVHAVFDWFAMLPDIHDSTGDGAPRVVHEDANQVIYELYTAMGRRRILVVTFGNRDAS